MGYVNQDEPGADFASRRYAEANGPDGAIEKAYNDAKHADDVERSKMTSTYHAYERITVIDTYTRLTRETAIYPGASYGSNGNDYEWPNAGALSYVALGLAGEAGEIANKVKKVLRDDNGILNLEKRDKIIAELGDVFWYMARLCDELGVEPSVVLAQNANKLFSRKDRGVLGGSGDNR